MALPTSADVDAAVATTAAGTHRFDLVNALLKNILLNVVSLVDDWTNGASGAVTRSLKLRLGEQISAKDFGALGDCRRIWGTGSGTMTAGSAVLTASQGPFTAADVTKVIWVPGAGSGASRLKTTILSYQSATQVTLAVTATTAVTNAEVSWGTDDTAAIVLYRLWVESRITPPPNLSGTLPQQGRGSMYFPAGAYLIQTAGTLINTTVTGSPDSVQGLTIRGDGTMLTQIIYDPGTAGALMDNQRWHQVRVRDMAFVGQGNAATSTLFKSTELGATSHVQDFRFSDIYVSGLWNNVFWATGTGTPDNNSEWAWEKCRMTDMTLGGPLLLVDTSDQFLNYRFDNCDIWSINKPVARFVMGGHLKFLDCDLSSFGTAATVGTPIYLIELVGQTHSRGVCSMSMRGCRGEMMTAYAYLLNTQWPNGNILIEACDFSSQAPNVGTYGAAFIYLDYGNNPGVALMVLNSQMVGGITSNYGVVAYNYMQLTEIRNCTWIDRLSPTDVVTYTPVAAHTNLGAKPLMRFEACRSEIGSLGADEKPIWDFRVGSTDAGGLLEERCYSIRGPWGALPSSTYGTINVDLPLGAMITKVVGFGPGTATITGSYTVKTTEGAPVTIATVTPGTAAWNTTVTTLATVATPYLCSTAAKAKLAIGSTTNVDANNSRLLIYYLG